MNNTLTRSLMLALGLSASLAWAQNAPLTVRQAIGIEALGSPATLHKRLSRLRSMELIKAVGFHGNRRTKYLAPTVLALKHFETLSQEMLRVKSSAAAAT